MLIFSYSVQKDNGTELDFFSSFFGCQGSGHQGENVAKHVQHVQRPNCLGQFTAQQQDGPVGTGTTRPRLLPTAGSTYYNSFHVFL
jgi:hypothetical protein